MTFQLRTFHHYRRAPRLEAKMPSSGQDLENWQAGTSEALPCELLVGSILTLSGRSELSTWFTMPVSRPSKGTTDGGYILAVREPS